MTREITHMRAFTVALESMNRSRFMISRIPPTSGLVDQYFKDSTGDGEQGEVDARGPWNEGAGFELVEAPAFRAFASANGGGSDGDTAVGDRTTSTAREPQMIEELLVDQLRDLLSAEAQLVKAMPKLVNAARAESLTSALESHPEETKAQVEGSRSVRPRRRCREQQAMQGDGWPARRR